MAPAIEDARRRAEPAGVPLAALELVEAAKFGAERVRIVFESFPLPAQREVIAGPARTGKTYAAYAIANDADDQGLWVNVWPAAELSAALKPDADASAYDHATACDLLVIDDLGRERATDWWLEQLQRVVDHRCAHERRIVVTTNSPGEAPEQAYEDLVKRYGDPIIERLIDDGGIVVLDGPPVRHLVTEW